MTTIRGTTRASLVVALLASAAGAQLADLQPGRNFTAEPNFGTGRSEEVDAADVELDGDLDVAVANGNQGTLQLARLFVNTGTGVFTDETATRFAGFPTMQARDIEFFDAEGDGDLDLFVANDRNGSAGAVSRFFANQGGVQAGAAGFFLEGTDTFWGSLVSVPASQQVFGGDAGPFRDFSCDCDFNDLDDDADLDLFFSTYGPSFLGTYDSRVFLNDGLGIFNELWPWADPGADTAWLSFEIELADCDGDFDLDLVTSGFGPPSRVFLNNLHGTSLGSEAFHEITQHALLDTNSGMTGSSHYETEFGDVDGDGDFDLWMVNYNNFTDRLLRNDGPDAGGFAFQQMNAWIKNDPVVDEEDGDFGDYDNDGDLDFFVANFSGTNWLYQSSLAQGLDPDTQGVLHRTGGPASGQAPLPELPSSYNGGQSLEGEWFDLDGDADLDIVLGNDANQGNWLFRNCLGVPDTHAPSFAAVTAQADKPNGTDTLIHAAARDNVPLTLFRYYAATLVFTVDGGAPQPVAMVHQGGQQFRGIIPAQTDATIEYHVEVTDLAGNTGVSATTSFVQGTDPWTDLGSGLAGVTGIPSLAGTGPLTAASAGTLVLSNAKPSALCALFVSLAGAGAPFKCGTLVPVPIALQLVLGTNGAGGLPLGWASWPSGLSGASLYFQYAIADGAAVCGTSLSNALRGDVP